MLPVLAVAVLLLALAAQMLMPVTTPLPDIGPSRVMAIANAAALRPVPVAASPMIAARTVFSPSRSHPGPVSAFGAAPGAVAVDTLVGSTLTGVVQARGYAVALLRDASGHAHTLRPGERLGGWRVVSIGRDSASFASGSTRRIVNVGETVPAPVAPPPAPASPEVQSQ